MIEITLSNYIFDILPLFVIWVVFGVFRTAAYMVEGYQPEYAVILSFTTVGLLILGVIGAVTLVTSIFTGDPIAPLHLINITVGAP